jgi:hypothetical protein
LLAGAGEERGGTVGALMIIGGGVGFGKLLGIFVGLNWGLPDALIGFNVALIAVAFTLT